MAHKKEDKKTKDFVDFLLEDSDKDYRLVKAGEVDYEGDEDSQEFVPLEDKKKRKFNENKELDDDATWITGAQNHKEPKTKVTSYLKDESPLKEEAHAAKDSDIQLEETLAPTQSAHDFPTTITDKANLTMSEESEQKKTEEVEESDPQALNENATYFLDEDSLGEDSYSSWKKDKVEEAIEAKPEEKKQVASQLEEPDYYEAQPVAAVSSETEAYDLSVSPVVASESLRLAQEKILSLEAEIDRLRDENQELQASAEVFRDKNDELLGQLDRLEYKKREIEEKWKDDVKLSQVKGTAKQQELQQMKVKVESLELRLRRDLQMVRVRERELENRLEISKMENSAVLRSKDEHILDLKRKIDQMSIESEQLKEKIGNLQQNSDIQKDKIRRTVRTLRLALNMLDEEEGKALESEWKKSG